MKINSVKTVSYKSGFYLHASSIEISGKILAFLGHSTSGKSTISKILSAEFPVVSDDKIYTYKNKKNWYAVNGDWNNIEYDYNKIINNCAERKEIISFVRIFKSDSNRIEKIDDLGLCKYLMDAVFEVDNQRKNDNLELRKNWFNYAADLSKNVQGWRFNFNKNKNIIKILKTIFEN